MSFTVKEKRTCDTIPGLLVFDAVMKYSVDGDALVKVPDTSQVVVLIVTPAMAGSREQFVGVPPIFVGLTLNDVFTVCDVGGGCVSSKRG